MFDMPDYKDVGHIITKLNHSYHFDDSPSESGIDDDILLETDSFQLLLPELGSFVLHPILGGTG
jgi:hypothetical protein